MIEFYDAFEYEASNPLQDVSDWVKLSGTNNYTTYGTYIKSSLSLAYSHVLLVGDPDVFVLESIARLDIGWGYYEPHLINAASEIVCAYKFYRSPAYSMRILYSTGMGNTIALPDYGTFGIYHHISLTVDRTLDRYTSLIVDNIDYSDQIQDIGLPEGTKNTITTYNISASHTYLATQSQWYSVGVLEPNGNGYKNRPKWMRTSYGMRPCH